MQVWQIVLIVILLVLIGSLIFLYFWGKKAQKRRDEQQGQIDAAAQTVSMLIIDKKKMRLKDTDLPSIIVDQVPWYMKRAKVPVVKAKVGPKIMTLIADIEIFDDIPTKKEVKATVSGIYITHVKGLRKDKKPAEEKKGFFSRFRKDK